MRNRELIVAAAREIFVEFGAEAPLDEIARRAGVGNATLYRHFADRGALIHDVLLSIMIRTADHAEAVAAQETDPFTALRRFAHAAVDERLGALCGTLVSGIDKDDPVVKAQCERLEDAVEGLMERARQAGALRRDVSAGDLVVALSQLTRPLPGMGCLDTDGVAHRHLELFLDGLQSSAPSELPGNSTDLEHLRPRFPETPCLHT
nr:TetR/AcrR family transcriptional regulator [Streptomyces sp. SID4948]